MDNYITIISASLVSYDFPMAVNSVSKSRSNFF
uniref:Uncharacterized protein n=1 Tax=Heterorhabditis bacteriophora TaxID=37862 RepID=A0A1I7WIQ1_HETBA